MAYTDEDIKNAILRVKEFRKPAIVRYFDGLIVMAQNEKDYEIKEAIIVRGDRIGFYTVAHALLIKRFYHE